MSSGEGAEVAIEKNPPTHTRTLDVSYNFFHLTSARPFPLHLASPFAACNLFSHLLVELASQPLYQCFFVVLAKYLNIKHISRQRERERERSRVREKALTCAGYQIQPSGKITNISVDKRTSERASERTEAFEEENSNVTHSRRFRLCSSLCHH